MNNFTERISKCFSAKTKPYCIRSAVCNNPKPLNYTGFEVYDSINKKVLFESNKIDYCKLFCRDHKLDYDII